jgi:ABC-type Zn uptake system ZnuABC Zn-binding protein ZnuA
VPRCISLLLAAVAGLAPAGASGAEPLQVVTTTPDLASLAEAVGGDGVSVDSLAVGPQDPHFVEPRPSFIRKLHDADLYVQVGMDLEVGWAPVLLRSARNADILPGARGFVDASTVVAPLQVPTAPVDRSMGDVHPYGNPHYLTDPLNGLRVAALLRDRLADLRPEAADGFAAGYEAFAERLAEAMVGPALARRLGAGELARRIEDGTLAAHLEEQGADDALGGWLGALRPGTARTAVQDHQLWAYFARRFGIELVATLEPRPGIAPTTRHLREVIERMRAADAHIILATTYFDARHARWVAEQTGATVVEMAHQPGARDGTGDYLAAVDHNVRGVAGAR